MFEATTLQTPFGICSLKRSARKTLGISVLPDGRIELSAPFDSTKAAILERLKKRRHWVYRQRSAFSAMNINRPPLRYCSGATHRYLGRQYRLRVINMSSECVKLKGGFFTIETKTQTAPHIQQLLEAWMRKRAQLQFEKRLRQWHPWCEHKGLPEPKLVIRKMAKRWGSAHPSGKIILNPDLIRTPSACIDYVITHEICHLKYPQHNQAFFKQLDELLPSWKELKQRLEQAEF